VPRTELFGSIDDDLHSVGSSLIARGLYPDRIKRQSYASGPGYISRLVETFKRPTRVIRRLLSLLVMYAKCPVAWRQDFLASVSSAKTDANLLEIPWMNYSVIDYLSEHIKLDARIFEYGSGSSTVYWAKRGASVVSVEHDKSFFLSQCSQLKQYSNVDYVLAEPQPTEAGQGSFQSRETFSSTIYMGYCFEDYVGSIRRFPVNSFDVVTVDGRARAACIRECVDWLRPGGLLILDNSDRTRYHQAISDALSHWVRVDFRGPVRGLLHEESTSIFRKPHD
jgi:SAM-dependent methyltransferase